VATAVEKLEKEFADWLGVRSAVATGFGRGALRLALNAVSVAGADVLVPEFVCRQVPEAVQLAGGHAVFYPVGRNLTVSAEAFRAVLTPRTRAAVVVHYFGRVLLNIPELVAICRERNVVLVEDCALALGAALAGRRAGTLGDISIFSFTKSDWCYGGGMVATNSPEWLAEARRVRVEGFASSSRLAFFYGLLRRADFLANRPRRSGAAERAGRWLERFSGLGDGNFYDAGRFDVRMPDFAAVRARGILQELAMGIERRCAVHASLCEALGDAAHILLRGDEEAGDAGSFLVLQSPAGSAREWVEQAARDGVTLRLTWPAYQTLSSGKGSDTLAWMAEHLVLLEVHPRLGAGEIERIAAALRRLRTRE